MRNKKVGIGLLIVASLWSGCQASRIERRAQRYYEQDSQPSELTLQQGDVLQTHFRLETHMDCGCICNIRAVQAAHIEDSSIVRLQQWNAEPVLLSGKRAAPNVGNLLHLQLKALRKGTTELTLRGDVSKYPCDQCKWQAWETAITLTVE